jgi:hypothetical protein
MRQAHFLQEEQPARNRLGITRISWVQEISCTQPIEGEGSISLLVSNDKLGFVSRLF